MGKNTGDISDMHNIRIQPFLSPDSGERTPIQLPVLNLLASYGCIISSSSECGKELSRLAQGEVVWEQELGYLDEVSGHTACT